MVAVLPVSAPSERTTIEPELMFAAFSIASACATASKMCVPVAGRGGEASADEILSFELVSVCAVVAVRLNSITPSCSLEFRRAANARAALNAAASGLPRMLQLVSISRTTPKVCSEA